LQRVRNCLHAGPVPGPQGQRAPGGFQSLLVMVLQFENVRVQDGDPWVFGGYLAGALVEVLRRLEIPKVRRDHRLNAEEVHQAFGIVSRGRTAILSEEFPRSKRTTSMQQ